MASRSPAQEDTPLLAPAGHNETSQDESLNSHSSDPKLRQNYLWLLATTIPWTIIVATLNFGAFWELALAGWAAGPEYYNKYADVAFSAGFIASVAGGLYSLVELLWFGCSRRRFHPCLDAIVFAALAVTVLFSTNAAILDRIFRKEAPCETESPQDRDSCEQWWGEYLFYTWIVLVLNVGLGVCYAYLTAFSMRRLGIKVNVGWGISQSNRDVEATGSEQPASHREDLIAEEA